MVVGKKPGTKRPADQGRVSGRIRSAGQKGGRGDVSPNPEGYRSQEERLAGLKQELEMATRRLETLQAAGERQRDFLSAQTHHIRAQLHAVLGYTELILRKNRDRLADCQVENLKKLLLSAEGLRTAIEGLAEFPWGDPKRSTFNKRS